eukprot:654662_1
MAAIVTADACENAVTVASEPNMHKKSTLEPPSPPELQSQESISVRRDRSLTAFLFEEIAGKKLKCYEKWKLWLGLFICMTVIAVVAIAFASYYAVKVNVYESKMDASNAQSTLIYDIVHEDTANISDHTDETRKIFNTFDDNADGVWSSDEFYDHFVLGSSVDVFNDIDEDGDDILSWREIASSISRHSLSQSYTKPVRNMYNITLNDTTDPLFINYAANVYLANHNIYEFGYITRAQFYAFRSNESFTYADSNDDNVINFDEFVQKIANDRMIGFMRQWNVESYLESINKTDSVRNIDPTSIGTANMCSNDYQHRRRLETEDEIGFGDDGELVYHYSAPDDDCQASLTCVNNLEWQGEIDTSIYGHCWNYQFLEIIECMAIAIDMYFEDLTNLVQCTIQMNNCMADTTHQWAFWHECQNINCFCECSEGCKGHIRQVWKEPDNPSRRLGKCDDKNCACGAGCTCFSGDNQMWIKRDDVVQNVLLKELRIGDYAQTKHGKWSKVWFIKEEESREYEFLKLHFCSDAYISMTNHHLLYVNEMTEQSMKRADEVKIGDIVFVMRNGTSFVEKEIVWIESTISFDGAYAPVTMEGSVVVNNVLSSCYVESVEKAQRLHDTAAVFRWMSSYNTNFASWICHLFYDSFFMKLRTEYGLDTAHIVFNAYSMPCIVVATVNVAIFGFVKAFSSVF